MKIHSVLKQLEENYIFHGLLWSEWIQTDECSLSEEDIYTVNVHRQNNFSLNLFDSFMFYNQIKHIERINAKLKWDLGKFKQWVILNFLFSIVELARKNGGQNYLHQPIGSLELSEEEKEALLQLKILYLNQIFEKYKEEDFEQEKIFNSIINFHTSHKTNCMKVYRQQNAEHIATSLY